MMARPDEPVERLTSSADPDGQLRAEGLSPQRWSAPAAARFGEHHHPAAKRLHVLRGSISFDGLELEAGQGIRIPAGRRHSAIVGGLGVDCVEAFEPEPSA